MGTSASRILDEVNRCPVIKPAFGFGEGEDGLGTRLDRFTAGDEGRGTWLDRSTAGDEGRGTWLDRLTAGDEGRGTWLDLFTTGDEGRGGNVVADIVMDRLLFIGDDRINKGDAGR